MRKNLVPVKRRDRNGVLRTVYVRPEATPTHAPLVPEARVAPTPAPRGSAARFPKAKLYEAATRPASTYVFGGYIQTTNELMDALARHGAIGGRKGEFRFRCTPLQFCDLLSVTSLDTAVVLLDGGITDSEEADSLLREWGLDELIEENGDIAAAIFRSGATPQLVLDRYMSTPETFYEDPDDFAAQLRTRLANDLKLYPVWNAIVGKEVSPELLQHIGIERFLAAEDEVGTIEGLLRELTRNPQAPIQTADINDWIDRFGIGEHQRAESDAEKRALLGLCARFGADFTADLSMARPVIANEVHRVALAADEARLDGGTARQAVAFAAAVWSQIYGSVAPTVQPTSRDLVRLHTAGISADAAVRGYGAGQSAQQILAIQSEGIAPGVSDGYL